MTAIKFVHEYEIRPRKDHRGVHLISDVLPLGRLWNAHQQSATKVNGFA
jgi:hypothetical protein